jgi:hypothetical protein
VIWRTRKHCYLNVDGLVLSRPERVRCGAMRPPWPHRSPLQSMRRPTLTLTQVRP